MKEALTGLRILALTQRLAGPFGAALLADLGAEVIKIEPPAGDLPRYDSPRLGPDMSAYFMNFNRNHKGIVLNLQNPKGRQVFYDLVQKADIVWENYRQGVMERLGLGYETLQKINPRIIYCSVSGFGSNGPYRDKPAYDLIAQAMSGSMSLTGEPEGNPVPWAVPIADLASGMFAALAVLAAVEARHKTGVGQKVEVAMLDGQISLLGYLAANYLMGGAKPQRLGSGQPVTVPYGAFATQDGYMVVCARGENFWQMLCRATGLEHLEKDPRFETNQKRVENRAELNAILQPVFRTKTTAQWLALLEGIPCGPVYTVEQALSDPQVSARNMVVEVDYDGRAVKLLSNPIKMFGTPIAKYEPAPGLGQHTRQVLSQLLGYSAEKLRQLEEEGAIASKE